MARVFISHSNRDRDAASKIKDWLIGQGFEAPFLDFDKHAGIAPGADWERTLYREIDRSEALVVLQTPDWLSSKWCFAEFTQGRALGKPIFPVIVAPTGDTLISPDIQALDLLQDREGGLARLSEELTRIALNAQGGFGWDASRPPYPGLLAMQEQDAAIYFGRDDEIRRLIERLNSRRALGGSQLIVVLGASGAGKSSLLRAGIIPRIRRDTANWIVLPVIRPQTYPVDQLARVFALLLRQEDSWRDYRNRLISGDPFQTLREISDDIRMKAKAHEAKILISIDQSEELFGASDPSQAARFFELLNVALTPDLPFICVMAQRSDFLEALQSSPNLIARFEEFSLPPLPLDRVRQIIEGPARVAGLRIDDDLVHQAQIDAQTADALPLLAFALRELFDRSGKQGILTLRDYRMLGDAIENLTPIENAVRKVADDVVAKEVPSEEQLLALRASFIPAMVRLNDQGQFSRQEANWHKLPAAAHRLLESLSSARLLVFRGHGSDRIVEVAHEALLRTWPLLRGWLEQEREFLSWRNRIGEFYTTWTTAPDPSKQTALLTGYALVDAVKWVKLRPTAIPDAHRQFIEQSIPDHPVDVAISKARKFGLGASFVLLLFVLFVGSTGKIALVATNPIGAALLTLMLTIGIALPTYATLSRNNQVLTKMLKQSYPLPVHADIKARIAMRERHDGKEIGGLLLFIGTVLITVLLVAITFFSFLTVGAVLENGLAVFHPIRADLSIGAYGSTMWLVASAYAAWLYVRRRRDFLTWFSLICLSPSLAILSASYASGQDVDVISSGVAAGIGSIGIAYIWLSKRSRSTFIK